MLAEIERILGVSDGEGVDVKFGDKYVRIETYKIHSGMFLCPVKFDDWEADRKRIARAGGIDPKYISWSNYRGSIND